MRFLEFINAVFEERANQLKKKAEKLNLLIGMWNSLGPKNYDAFELEGDTNNQISYAENYKHGGGLTTAEATNSLGFDVDTPAQLLTYSFELANNYGDIPDMLFIFEDYVNIPITEVWNFNDNKIEFTREKPFGEYYISIKVRSCNEGYFKLISSIK
jgi:hypothetical protein